MICMIYSEWKLFSLEKVSTDVATYVASKFRGRITLDYQGFLKQILYMSKFYSEIGQKIDSWQSEFRIEAPGIKLFPATENIVKVSNFAVIVDYFQTKW